VGIYSVTVLGNVEQCRTEAEISLDEQLVAVVYETSDGWHTEVIASQLTPSQDDFEIAVNTALQTLSHYVNRRGENPPRNATRETFALWLMMKDDGTAMGIPSKNGVRS